MPTLKVFLKKISPEQLFMFSVLVVNGGNYIYNLLLGRILGPEAFAEAALLITLLLVLSFVGMTFQLTTAKFAVIFSDKQWSIFKNRSYKQASFVGIIAGLLIIIFSRSLQSIFHTQSHWMFVLFGFGVPLYFFMSVNRGIYQGKQNFKNLSITYQTEMWSKLVLTLLLLILIPLESSFLVALGIVISFFFGLIPSDIEGLDFKDKEHLLPENSKRVNKFMILTICYEFTQIIINNSDILLVKHYFNSLDAGLYASLALIGRVVYFVAWMFVMLLLPTVVQKQKDGEPTAPILFKYVGYIALLSTTIILACYIMPEFIITIMFGKAYITMAGLLWQYALATSLFAIANIFAYYFLSLDRYVPVILSGILGMSQIVLVIFFHDNLTTVVQVQIVAMAILLAVQITYFLTKKTI